MPSRRSESVLGSVWEAVPGSGQCPEDTQEYTSVTPTVVGAPSQTFPVGSASETGSTLLVLLTILTVVATSH